MQNSEKIEAKNIPLPAQERLVSLHAERFTEKNPGLALKVNEAPYKDLTTSIFGNSPYLSDIIIKNAEFYFSLLDDGFEDNFDKLIDDIAGQHFESEADIMRSLREQKQKASLLIAITEITKLWDIDTTTKKLSLFADHCTFKACEFMLKDAHEKQIIKLKDPEKPMTGSGLVVIALGKLGSNELNYSSDIDLAIYYEDDKLEYLGRKSLAQFYIEFAQGLTKILSERTRDGYVFRVDMRLRPDPGSNPLAVGLKKAEKYYFTVGQNWERAAFIKNRFICGDKRSGATFNEFMKRNVWRKSLDFETIEDIHSIKRQINTKQGMHPNDLYGYNVKLGSGGIREIEFYAQTQQLIWGGRKILLRERKTSDALYALVEEGEVKKEVADELIDALVFYRMVEHRLQMVNDEQTHTLPTEKEEMQNIAVFCGFKDSEKFLKLLLEKISIVRKHYIKLFETSPSLASDLPEASGSLIFTGTENHPDTIDTLSKMGFEEPNRVSDIVRGWHHGRIPVTTKKRARAELTKLMPFLFTAFAKSSKPDESFIRFDEFLSKLPESSQIFSLLYMNPNILSLLAEIFGGYPEIAQSLSRNPSLIEYIVVSEFYNTLPDIERLEKNLERELMDAKADLDTSMEIIKAWAEDRKFRIGIQLVRDKIPAEQVFHGLSNIAETVLRATMKLLDKDMGKELSKIDGGKFAVLAYGKLGSHELTFNSDLDLVFVYDFKKESGNISASTLYIKYAGRLISLLSTVTEKGKLYEVDARLRPLGEKGPLAINIKSFDEYYNPGKEGSAWVYEYIALTRARAIALDETFEKKVQKMIKSKFAFKWNDKTLHKEASFVYEKFRASKKQKNELDIKNAEGGLFELEFMVRFLQLEYLSKFPKLYDVSTSKTIEQLHKNKVLNAAEFQKIKAAYSLYKEVQNILRITSETSVTNYTENLLCKTLGLKNSKELYKKLESTKKDIKNLFGKFV